MKKVRTIDSSRLKVGMKVKDTIFNDYVLFEVTEINKDHDTVWMRKLDDNDPDRYIAYPNGLYPFGYKVDSSTWYVA